MARKPVILKGSLNLPLPIRVNARTLRYIFRFAHGPDVALDIPSGQNSAFRRAVRGLLRDLTVELQAKRSEAAQQRQSANAAKDALAFLAARKTGNAGKWDDIPARAAHDTILSEAGHAA